MKPCFELQHYHNMIPQAEVSLDGYQLHWETDNGKRQHSITYYGSQESEGFKTAKFMAQGCNDVKFLENYRFSSTYTP